MVNDFKYAAQLSRAETTDRFARHVSSGKVEFFRTAGIDFVMGRREGPFLWDVTGEPRLIDCHCNGGVFNLGHRHPEIVRALMASSQELDIGNHHLISEQRAALAEKLAELMPGDITYAVFGVSGGEAIDLAIKVARSYTGRPGSFRRRVVITGTPAWRSLRETKNIERLLARCHPASFKSPSTTPLPWKTSLMRRLLPCFSRQFRRPTAWPCPIATSSSVCVNCAIGAARC